METPLSPLEFLRRARRLYPDREAVVDEGLRFTYSEFSRRCDRWSAALQRLGVSKEGRPRRLHCSQHSCPTRILLRHTPDWGGTRPNQLSPHR